MFRFLDKHKITFRNAKVISEEGQEERLKYYEEVEKIAEENLIDETGVWEGMERSRSRAERGKRPFGLRPRNHGQKHTIIGAISIHGVVCFKMIKGSMKGEDFEKFIKEDLCPRLDATKVVGMDNLNCHKRKEIIEAIEKTGARVMFLPNRNAVVDAQKFSESTQKPNFNSHRTSSQYIFMLVGRKCFRNFFAQNQYHLIKEKAVLDACC